MAGTCRQDCHVSGLDGHDTTLETAELHLGSTTGNAKDFMNARMVMDVIVNAVAPGVAPSVLHEEFLEHSRWIESTPKSHRTAVDDQRPVRMVRNDAVVLETEGLRFSRPHEPSEVIRRRPRPSGSFLGNFFERFQRGHRRVLPSFTPSARLCLTATTEHKAGSTDGSPLTRGTAFLLSRTID